MAEPGPLDARAMTGPATALLALWNDVDPACAAEYEAWHAVEHVPERLTVPGMEWAYRFGRAAAPRYLTLYGLRDAGVLEGAAYQRLLREPTPLSRRMRPALQNVSRWVCTLVEARGLEQGSHLAVWTAGQEDHGPARGLLHPARGRLVAQRLPQASPLPWLHAGQAQAIEGHWLMALTLGGPGPADAAVYARLPVG